MISYNEHRPYKRARLYGALNASVTLLVGEDGVAILVHKDILCAASPGLEAACESERRVIKFPDDDLEVVQSLVYWMYNDKICIPDGRPLFATFCLLAKLYIIAVRYRMVRLQNDTMDALVGFLKTFNETNSTFEPSIIPPLWDSIKEDFLLRRFLADFIRLYHGASTFGTTARTIPFPADFVLDFACQLLENGDDEVRCLGKEPWKNFCLKYHAHTRIMYGQCNALKEFETYSETEMEEDD